MMLSDNIKSYAMTHNSILKMLPSRIPFAGLSMRKIQIFRKVVIVKAKIVIASIC